MSDFLHTPENPLETLRSFYEKLTIVTSALEKIHQDRLKCTTGCNACCLDDLEVFGIEAELIESHHQNLLHLSNPFPIGKCAFLGDEGECRIYNERPFVCRTHGLPIRWKEMEENEMIEYRDICFLNEEGQPIENLAENECFTFQPFEERLALIQLKNDNGEGKRVKLRSLFKNK